MKYQVLANCYNSAVGEYVKVVATFSIYCDALLFRNGYNSKYKANAYIVEVI